MESMHCPHVCVEADYPLSRLYLSQSLSLFLIAVSIKKIEHHLSSGFHQGCCGFNAINSIDSL